MTNPSYVGGAPSLASTEIVHEACLVEDLIAGCEEALTHLYERHAPVVFAAATRASGDHSIAAEVVQETFLALWNQARLFDPSRGQLRAWLLAIAHNRAVDHLRRARRHDRAASFSSFDACGDANGSTIDWLATSGQPIAGAGAEPGPEAWLFREETRAAVAAAVASLSQAERSVISLAYYRGLSQSEIASRLGWPIGTVKTRTRSALRHLRERLELPDGGSDRVVLTSAEGASGHDRLPQPVVPSASPRPGDVDLLRLAGRSLESPSTRCERGSVPTGP